MNVKPGYKQTEVGAIPDDWQIDYLSRYWTVIDCKHLTAHFVSSGFPVVSIQEVASRFVDLIYAKQTTRKFYDLLIEGGRRPRPSDLILSRNATVGDVAQVLESHPPFAMGQDVCLLRKKSPEFSTDFMQAVFRSPIITNQLADLMVGSTFKRVNIQQIRNFIVPMPQPAEQKAVGDAIRDADAFIESVEHLIAKKSQLKQGAMQELLTGKRRLPGFEGKSGLRQTEVGEIPEDWEVEKLAAICSMKSGESITADNIDQSSKYPCYGGNGLRGFTSRFTHKGCYALIGRQGALCGNVLGVEGEFFASEHAVVVTPFERTDIRWLTFTLGEMRLNQYSESSAQPGLSVSKLLGLYVAHPSTKAEQTAIATVLNDMDAEITALEVKLAKARQLNQGMMQELLTGKTRLI